MIQLLKFDEPIPSCLIHSLKFNKENNKWEYIYALSTPEELTNNKKFNLIIYEYISDLKLKDGTNMHPDSINIKIRNLDEYLFYLNKQREADLSYRRKWIKEHNIEDYHLNTVELYNKDYSNEDLNVEELCYISRIVEQKDDKTIFAAIRR